jgi:hypothetical protein
MMKDQRWSEAWRLGEGATKGFFGEKAKKKEKMGLNRGEEGRKKGKNPIPLPLAKPPKVVKNLTTRSLAILLERRWRVSH